jgi:hypothetical protein
MEGKGDKREEKALGRGILFFCRSNIFILEEAVWELVLGGSLVFGLHFTGFS